MKKIFLITLLFCAGVVSSFAQEGNEAEGSEVAKKTYDFLPVQGDFGISVDASPFLKYLGNMFNDTQNNPAPWFGNDNKFDFTIRGIYFLEDNRSVRATLNLNIGNEIYKGTVQNDYYVLTQPDYNGQTVIDVNKHSFTEVDLGVGYGYHRGYGRLQASYGPQIGFHYSSGCDYYTYANEINEANQLPSTNNFGGNLAGNERLLEQTSGKMFGFSVGAFAGVEYFFTSRMSIRGEIGLSFQMNNRWQGEATAEKWDAAQGKVVENSTRSLNGYTGGITLRTITNNGLFLNFYF